MELGIEGEKLEALAKITGAVSTAIVAAASFCKWVLPRLASRVVRKSYVAYFEDAHRVRRDMDGIRRESGAHRVIMFSAHNCGGMPCVGKPFYTSSLDWSLNTEHESRFPSDGYQRLPVDAVYIGMLLEMTKAGHLRVNVAALPADCMISRFYAAEGVVDSVWYYIAGVDSQLAYMSVANYERKFTDAELTRIELSVNTIRNRFK